MKWYYLNAGSQVGPIDDSDFQALVRAGEIKSKTLVWQPGMSDWEKYGRVKIGGANPAPQAAGMTHAREVSICSECGRDFPQDEMIRYEGSWVCATCKPIFVQKVKEGVSLAGEMEYGGFWIRFGAKLLDAIILGMVNFGISMAGGFMAVISEQPAFLIVAQLLPFLITVAYATWFIGRFGATLGKMACGLKVVRPDGEKVSYARALGRHFAEYLSGIIFLIGYIMAAFDDEKRTLHDRICDTRVVRK